MGRCSGRVKGELCLRGVGKRREGFKRFPEPLEGLIVVAGLRGVSEGLADVAVGPLVGRVAVVGGVRYRVGALGLRGTVLRVVEVEAVADVAEETRGRLLLALRHALHEADGGREA